MQRTSVMMNLLVKARVIQKVRGYVIIHYMLHVRFDHLLRSALANYYITTLRYTYLLTEKERVVSYRCN